MFEDPQKHDLYGVCRVCKISRVSGLLCTPPQVRSVLESQRDRGIRVVQCVRGMRSVRGDMSVGIS